MFLAVLGEELFADVGLLLDDEVPLEGFPVAEVDFVVAVTVEFGVEERKGCGETLELRTHEFADCGLDLGGCCEDLLLSEDITLVIDISESVAHETGAGGVVTVIDGEVEDLLEVDAHGLEPLV